MAAALGLRVARGRVARAGGQRERTVTGGGATSAVLGRPAGASFPGVTCSSELPRAAAAACTVSSNLAVCQL
jgi:hypothetical protein